MAQWVVLHPLFEVCTREKGCEQDGSRREAWWSQEATEKQLRVALEGISWEDKRRRIFG